VVILLELYLTKLITVWGSHAVACDNFIWNDLTVLLMGKVLGVTDLNILGGKTS
jgi:hypothetical protein